MGSVPHASRVAQWIFEDDSESEVNAAELDSLIGLGLRVEEDNVRPELPPQNVDVFFFEEQMISLKAENKHLKSYASRLQAELARKFMKTPSLSDEASLESEVAPWVSNPHMFSPLLGAYDARLTELQNSLQLARSELEQSRELIDELSEENSQLHFSLKEHVDERVKALEQNISKTTSKSQQWGAVANETIEELNEQLDLVMKENAVITEQVSILENDVTRLSEQGQERDQNLVRISKNFQAATAALKTSQQNVQILRQERDSALKRVNELASEVSAVSVSYESVVGDVEVKQREIDSLNRHIVKFRSELEELVHKANADNELQEQKSKVLSKRTREIKIEYDSLQTEHSSLKENLRQIKAEKESTHQDCEEMLKVVTNLKKQVAELTIKLDSTKSSLAEQRANKDQAELECKQAMACETQSRREIARLLEAREVDAKGHAQLTQSTVAEVRAKLVSQLSSRNSELERYAQLCARLTKDAERSKHEQREAVNRLESLRNQSVQEFKKGEITIQQVIERVEAAEERSVDREAQAQRTVQEAQVRIAEMNSERIEIQEQMRSLQASLQSSVAQSESSALEFKRMTKECDESNKDAIRARQELASLRLNTDARLETTEERRTIEEQKAVLRVSQADSKCQVLSQELELVKQQMERLKIHHAEEIGSNVAHFEKLVGELKEENCRLRARTEELASQLHYIQHELSENKGLIVHQEETIRKLDIDLNTSTRKATAMKSQIAELLAIEEDKVKELTVTRRRIDQVELQCNKIKRERDAALEQLESRNTVLEERLPDYDNRFLNPKSPSSRKGKLRLESDRPYF